MVLCACGTKRPHAAGASSAGLASCPQSPNCVSSTADDPAHRVEPLRAAWERARAAVAALPRTRIVSETDTYLHAECRSRVLRFVDDLELRLRASPDIIDVRSAARRGYWDFGVNRHRVEDLRKILERPGASE